MSAYSKAQSAPWSENDQAAASVQTDPTDLLIQRCLAGEEVAYTLLYHQYATIIYRLVYGMLRHQHDAEEVVQDSFEYAFRKLSHFDARKASFKTWLYRIAISRCRNKRRRKWLPTFSLSQMVEADIEDRHGRSPVEAAVLSERQQLVWQALGTLSDKLRETALLRYYEGLTYAEIGDILDIPAKTAESRMRLVHKTLRQEIPVDQL